MPKAKRPLPRIITNDRDLRDITADAIDVLLSANKPPKLFLHGRRVARVVDSDTGPQLEHMNHTAVRGHLARAADWRQKNPTGSGYSFKPTNPPGHVVADLLALEALPLPKIRRITRTPTFAPDASLHASAGYDEASQCYLEPDPAVEVADVLSNPTSEDIAAAIAVMDQLFNDFPFVGPADRAHTIALALGPFIRDMVDGNTPLHLVTSPQAGSGKTLLVQLALLPALGAFPSFTWGTREDENRKLLTSQLLRGPSVLFIDNTRGSLDSPVLASALTTGLWEDRVLGASEMADLPVRCVWVMTGNNVDLSTELARRTVAINLDTGTERPWEGRTFTHGDIVDWARSNRGALVHAALTLVQAWTAAGSPTDDGPGACQL